MAALSDYLESGLLSHIFRNTALTRPSVIAIALTSGVPIDTDTGSTIPELPSGVSKGANFVTTNYKRISLFNPATSGNSAWNQVGVDDTTAFEVLGTSASGTTSGLYGYYYPLYLNNSTSNSAGNGSSQSYRFKEYPGVIFYAPVNLQQSGVASSAGYTSYEGNGFIKNAVQLVFNTALTDWGWVSGIAITDSADHKSGNLLMYAQLTNPRFVYTGDNIKFDVNALEISLK